MTYKRIDILVILENLVAYLLSKVLCFFPRKSNLWAFGASGGFRDNPKYLFYEVIEKHPEITPVWIANSKKDCNFLKSQGMNTYFWRSLKGLFYSIRAKVYIVDHTTADINRFLCGGAYYVNLWHGSSVKRVRWQNTDFFVKTFNLKDESEMRTSFWFKMRNYIALFSRPDFCIAPSTIQLKEFFAPMMDISEENCMVAVFPRSRLMIEGKDMALDFIKNYEPSETMEFIGKLQSYNKTYIYMPTWRDDGCDFIEQAGIDWHRLDDVMKATNSLFILKLHPFTRLNLDNLLQYSNISLYPNNSDVYAVLPFIDCLITDYSSIYTDFLMMNKEIILFVFDYQNYVGKSNWIEDYDKFYLGKRAYDFNQLILTIESGEDCHIPQEQYDLLMNFFWDNNRQNIDIADEIKKRIGLR